MSILASFLRSPWLGDACTSATIEESGLKVVRRAIRRTTRVRRGATRGTARDARRRNQLCKNEGVNSSVRLMPRALRLRLVANCCNVAPLEAKAQKKAAGTN